MLDHALPFAALRGMVRGMKKIISFMVTLLTVALVAAVAVFAAANRANVAVSLYPLPYEISSPLYLLILLAFALGVLVSWAMMLGAQWKMALELHRARKRAEALEGELALLKNPPEVTP